MSDVKEQISLQIPTELAGERLDKALADLVEDSSRSTIQRWLREGLVRLDGKKPLGRQKLLGGERVEIDVPPAPGLALVAQAMALDIVYEDESIIVLHKPAGLVVHPGAGNPDGTLANGLLHYDPALTEVARAGIVHRLDKDTSGVMVVARTEAARLSLVEQLSTRTMTRRYQALVCGEVISGDTVDEPIGRDSRDRRRMAVVVNGKPAVTHFRVADRFRGHTLLDVQLETGRTHQIRVHMAFIGFAVFGDPVYGRRLALPTGASDNLRTVLSGFRRQALHAAHLTLIHPASGESRSFERPPPDDMSRVVDQLRIDMQIHLP